MDQPDPIPVRTLSYEQARHTLDQRLIRAILWIGVVLACLGLARAAFDSLGCLGIIAIPSWITNLAEMNWWSFAAALALIAGWTLNLGLLLGCIFCLQHRPVGSYLLDRYARLSIGFNILWALAIGAYVCFVGRGNLIPTSFTIVTIATNGLLSAFYPAVILLVLYYPPTRMLLLIAPHPTPSAPSGLAISSAAVPPGDRNRPHL